MGRSCIRTWVVRNARSMSEKNKELRAVVLHEGQHWTTKRDNASKCGRTRLINNEACALSQVSCHTANRASAWQRLERNTSSKRHNASEGASPILIKAITAPVHLRERWEVRCGGARKLRQPARGQRFTCRPTCHVRRNRDQGQDREHGVVATSSDPHGSTENTHRPAVLP